MYRVEADRGKRVFVITAAGHVIAPEITAGVRELETLLEDVALGFGAATISHSVATASSMRTPASPQSWRGNGWKPGEVIQKLREISQAQL